MKKQCTVRKFPERLLSLLLAFMMIAATPGLSAFAAETPEGETTVADTTASPESDLPDGDSESGDPDEEPATPPGEETTTPPGGETTPPGGETTPPGEETTTPPGEETITPPGEGEGKNPEDPTDPADPGNPADPTQPGVQTPAKPELMSFSVGTAAELKSYIENFHVTTTKPEGESGSNETLLVSFGLMSPPDNVPLPGESLKIVFTLPEDSDVTLIQDSDVEFSTRLEGGNRIVEMLYTKDLETGAVYNKSFGVVVLGNGVTEHDTQSIIKAEMFYLETDEAGDPLDFAPVVVDTCEYTSKALYFDWEPVDRKANAAELTARQDSGADYINNLKISYTAQETAVHKTGKSYAGKIVIEDVFTVSVTDNVPDLLLTVNGTAIDELAFGALVSAGTVEVLESLTVAGQEYATKFKVTLTLDNADIKKEIDQSGDKLNFTLTNVKISDKFMASASGTTAVLQSTQKTGDAAGSAHSAVKISTGGAPADIAENALKFKTDLKLVLKNPNTVEPLNSTTINEPKKNVSRISGVASVNTNYPAVMALDIVEFTLAGFKYDQKTNNALEYYRLADDKFDAKFLTPEYVMTGKYNGAAMTYTVTVTADGKEYYAEANTGKDERLDIRTAFKSSDNKFIEDPTKITSIVFDYTKNNKIVPGFTLSTAPRTAFIMSADAVKGEKYHNYAHVEVGYAGEQKTSAEVVAGVTFVKFKDYLEESTIEVKSVGKSAINLSDNKAIANKLPAKGDYLRFDIEFTNTTTRTLQNLEIDDFYFSDALELVSLSLADLNTKVYDVSKTADLADGFDGLSTLVTPSSGATLTNVVKAGTPNADGESKVTFYISGDFAPADKVKLSYVMRVLKEPQESGERIYNRYEVYEAPNGGGTGGPGGGGTGGGPGGGRIPVLTGRYQTKVEKGSGLPIVKFEKSRVNAAYTAPASNNLEVGESAYFKLLLTDKSTTDKSVTITEIVDALPAGLELVSYKIFDGSGGEMSSALYTTAVLPGTNFGANPLRIKFLNPTELEKGQIIEVRIETKVTSQAFKNAGDISVTLQNDAFVFIKEQSSDYNGIATGRDDTSDLDGNPDSKSYMQSSASVTAIRNVDNFTAIEKKVSPSSYSLYGSTVRTYTVEIRNYSDKPLKVTRIADLLPEYETVSGKPKLVIGGTTQSSLPDFTAPNSKGVLLFDYEFTIGGAKTAGGYETAVLTYDALVDEAALHNLMADTQKSVIPSVSGTIKNYVAFYSDNVNLQIKPGTPGKVVQEDATDNWGVNDPTNRRIQAEIAVNYKIDFVLPSVTLKPYYIQVDGTQVPCSPGGSLYPGTKIAWEVTVKNHNVNPLVNPDIHVILPDGFSVDTASVTWPPFTAGGTPTIGTLPDGRVWIKVETTGLRLGTGSGQNSAGVSFKVITNSDSGRYGSFEALAFAEPKNPLTNAKQDFFDSSYANTAAVPGSLCSAVWADAEMKTGAKDNSYNTHMVMSTAKVNMQGALGSESKLTVTETSVPANTTHSDADREPTKRVITLASASNEFIYRAEVKNTGNASGNTSGSFDYNNMSIILKLPDIGDTTVLSGVPRQSGVAAEFIAGVKVIHLAGGSETELNKAEYTLAYAVSGNLRPTEPDFHGSGGAMVWKNDIFDGADLIKVVLNDGGEQIKSGESFIIEVSARLKGDADISKIGHASFAYSFKAVANTKELRSASEPATVGVKAPVSDGEITIEKQVVFKSDLTGAVINDKEFTFRLTSDEKYSDGVLKVDRIVKVSVEYDPVSGTVAGKTEVKKLPLGLTYRLEELLDPSDITAAGGTVLVDKYDTPVITNSPLVLTSAGPNTITVKNTPLYKSLVVNKTLEIKDNTSVVPGSFDFILYKQPIAGGPKTEAARFSIVVTAGSGGIHSGSYTADNLSYMHNYTLEEINLPAHYAAPVITVDHTTSRNILVFNVKNVRDIPTSVVLERQYVITKLLDHNTATPYETKFYFEVVKTKAGSAPVTETIELDVTRGSDGRWRATSAVYSVDLDTDVKVTEIITSASSYRLSGGSVTSNTVNNLQTTTFAFVNSKKGGGSWPDPDPNPGGGGGTTIVDPEVPLTNIPDTEIPLGELPVTGGGYTSTSPSRDVLPVQTFAWGERLRKKKKN